MKFEIVQFGSDFYGKWENFYIGRYGDYVSTDKGTLEASRSEEEAKTSCESFKDIWDAKNGRVVCEFEI